jgi:AcrR family transcriptional regulator
MRSARTESVPVSKPVRRRNPEATKSSLLEAATMEFARHGWGGARVERIVREAGCNMRMLYHYFESKENLYIQVLEAVYRDIREKERALDLHASPPRDALRKLASFTWRHFMANRVFIDITRNENLEGGRFITQSAEIATMSSPLIALIAETLEKGRRSEDFRFVVDPLQLYISIVALSSHHLSNAHTLSATFKTDLTSPEWLEQRRLHMETMVLRMVGARED